MALKLILDTNIYYSALGFDNLLYKILYYLNENSNLYRQYISDLTFKELSSKLHSEAFDQKTKNKILKEEKDKFLDLIKVTCILENPTSKVNLCRDPRDNMFLELAKEVKAGFIISGDKDLLELKQFENTKILKPSEFIEELKLDLE